MKSKLIKSIFLLFLGLLIISASQTSSALTNFDIDQEIENLNLKIQNQKKQIEALQTKQKKYQAEIAAKQSDQASLNNQLAIIENRLGKAKLDIEETRLEIETLIKYQPDKYTIVSKFDTSHIGLLDTKFSEIIKITKK